MKILIDIGHPAHVHYFRNIYNILGEKGIRFLFVCRDKEVSQILCQHYNINYVSRGKGKKSLLGKIIYTLYADQFIIRKSLKFKPDIYLSFASPYAAHASRILRKPHISITDTEHAKLGLLGFAPFTKTILTPRSFTGSFGSKHLYFDSFMELAYLYPKYFTPDKDILRKINIKKGEKYVVLRFVSWDASHDIGQKGLSLDMKIRIAKELSKYCKVFISSEDSLPNELKSFQLKIEPYKIHDVLNFASLYIGEGATMASECAMLGTPAIYVNTLDAGTLQEQAKYALIYNFRNADKVLETAVNIINDPKGKAEYQKNREKMLSKKIDLTAFLVWFVENYPKSVQVMKEEPDYQMRFKS